MSRVLFISPEAYFDFNYELNGQTPPEGYSLPMRSLFGVPVIVDPDLHEGEYIEMETDNFVQDYLVATNQA